MDNVPMVVRSPKRSDNHVGRLGWIQLAVAILKQCRYPDDDHEWLMGLKEYVVSLSEEELHGL